MQQFNSTHTLTREIEKARKKHRLAYMTTDDIQEGFFKFVFNNDQNITKIVDAEHEDALCQLELYRATGRLTLVSVIHRHFPRTLRALPQEITTQLVSEFVMQRPPSERIPYLFAYGASFPFFIKENPLTQDLLAIHDLCSWEWHNHWAHFEAHSPVLSIADFQRLSPQELEEMSLVIHPALRLLSFQYDVASLLAAEVDARSMDDNINDADWLTELSKIPVSPQNAFIMRKNGAVICEWVTQDYADFIAALIVKKNLREANREALRSNPRFDLMASLLQLCEQGCLTMALFLNRSPLMPESIPDRILNDLFEMKKDTPRQFDATHAYTAYKKSHNLLEL